jgi:hypothetical protein
LLLSVIPLFSRNPRHPYLHVGREPSAGGAA